MRPRPRRSSNAARPSSASGGCAIALSPTASRKPATACSPSHGCRQVSGEAREQRTRSSVCTKSSSGGSRRRPCCRRQKRQRCCSGRCSPLVRSTCARLMVGRRSPQSPSINRLTSPPDQILSKCRRSRHQIPTPLATAPADLRSFFDSVSQQWLIRFLKHRINDTRMLRLIQKWLKAGVLEDEVVTVSDRGTGQGSVISPLLANVYLHYVFDLWAERWRHREAVGNVIIVRYADDLIIGFELDKDARRFQEAMCDRLREFSLSLHPEKTRLIEFGRFAVERRAHRRLGKPETFNFLGFTFICGTSSGGQFQIKRKTRRDRMRAKLKEIKEEMRQRRHHSIPEQGHWLRQVVTGFFAYHAVPTNIWSLGTFRFRIIDLWRRSLRRRSQKDGTTWRRITKLTNDFLPRARILHPWPQERFAVKYPRWEPSARMGPARFCAGGAQ